MWDRRRRSAFLLTVILCLAPLHAAAELAANGVVLQLSLAEGSPSDMEVERNQRDISILRLKLESTGGEAAVSALTLSRQGTPLASQDFWKVSIFDESRTPPIELASGDFDIDQQLNETLILRFRSPLRISPSTPRVLLLRADISYNATPGDTHRLEIRSLETQAAVRGLGLKSAEIRIRDFSCCGVGEPTRVLWVSEQGRDTHDGRSPQRALRTIAEAARRAQAGTAIYVMPGIYREENIAFAHDGTEERPILLTKAPNTDGAVVLRGSVHASDLAWEPVSPGTCPRLFPNALGDCLLGRIYSTSLTVTPDMAPRFIVELDEAGNFLRRYPLAREPDWTVPQDTPWKYNLLWWTASGSENTYSSRFLTDIEDDTTCEPNDECRSTEHGNLTSDFLGDLTGARIYIDGRDSYVQEAVIKSHNRRTGTVELHRPLLSDEDCASGRLPRDYCYANPIADYGGTYPPFGRWSKYYLEDKPQFLDSEGEWWYDRANRRLYFFAPRGVNPGTLNIEISVRDSAFIFGGKSHIVLENLTVEYYNGNLIRVSNLSIPREQTRNLIFHNLKLRGGFGGISVDASYGCWLRQNCDPQRDVPTDREYNIDGVRIEGSEIAWMDNAGIDISAYDHLYYSDVFHYPLIRNVTIRRNAVHDVYLHRSAPWGGGTPGIRFYPVADQVVIDGNHVYNIGSESVTFAETVVVQRETKVGSLLIADNVIEKACLHDGDCGALRFWGWPHDIFFEDVLIYRNKIMNTFGWDYLGFRNNIRNSWPPEYAPYAGGVGNYLDWGTNIHVFRNIFFNNGTGIGPFEGYRLGRVYYFNNTVVNSGRGLSLGFIGSEGVPPDKETVIKNNIFVASGEWAGEIAVLRRNEQENYTYQDLDYNLYYSYGFLPDTETRLHGLAKVARWTRRSCDGEVKWCWDGDDVYGSLRELRMAIPVWERHGLGDVNPMFRNYPTNYERHRGILNYTASDFVVPDLRLAPNSPAIDRGTSLHPSLKSLLDRFRIKDKPLGRGYDLGAFESIPPLPASSPAVASSSVPTATAISAVASTVPPSTGDSGSDTRINCTSSPKNNSALRVQMFRRYFSAISSSIRSVQPDAQTGAKPGTITIPGSVYSRVFITDDVRGAQARFPGLSHSHSRQADQFAKIQRGTNVRFRSHDPPSVINPIIIRAAFHLELLTGERVNDVFHTQHSIRPSATEFVLHRLAGPVRVGDDVGNLLMRSGDNL
ncbi:MAG TPA: hypothetical protein VNM72_09105 [Blastocatellia bacterium]|nr:hypothetical protein [Blastocatellia bacterium]